MARLQCKFHGRTRHQWIELLVHHAPHTFDRVSLRTMARPDLVARQYGLMRPRHSERLTREHPK